MRVKLESSQVSVDEFDEPLQEAEAKDTGLWKGSA